MIKPEFVENKTINVVTTTDPPIRQRVLCVHSGSREYQDAYVIKYAPPELRDEYMRALEQQRLNWGASTVFPTFWLSIHEP